MNELVSIIMPSYNTGEFIEDSIKSVLNQSYSNWELIIIDDCSTDNTDEVVQKFLSDKRIKYIKNDKNSGAAISRNKALKLAKGKWIAFLDSDDLWTPLKLEKQICFMEKNNYYFSYTEHGFIDEHSKSNNKLRIGPKKINKSLMYGYCWVSCLTVMYDSDVVGLIQINDIKKNNDYAIWLKVIKKANCYLLKENLASYRIRKGSISNQNYFSLIKWHYRLFRLCDNKNPFCAIVLTLNNLILGIIKKIFFVKTIGEKNGK